MTTDKTHRFDTRVVHAGDAPDPSTGAHGTPLYQNATFAFTSYEQVEALNRGDLPHFIYQRDGNPTVRVLELKLADLEGAEDAVCATTGMAAISAVLFHLAGNGGHIIAAADLYYYSKQILNDDLPAMGASATLVDTRDLDAIAAAFQPNTRAVYVEPFSNPGLRAADIPAIAKLAHDRGALLVVDNTFLSPVLCRPLEHGADIVIHSATKYIAGHGQAMGGVILGACCHIEAIRHRIVRTGSTLAPFPAWMLGIGIKTMALRVHRATANALAVATLLADHPAVAQVNYPGLPTDPGHPVAQSIANGHGGGLLSFTLNGGTESIRRFINALTLCTIAVSLGEPTTLVWPYGDGELIRLAVGIEDEVDLLDDICRGLDALGA